jgi:hypothetical protein
MSGGNLMVERCSSTTSMVVDFSNVEQRSLCGGRVMMDARLVLKNQP